MVSSTSNMLRAFIFTIVTINLVWAHAGDFSYENGAAEKWHLLENAATCKNGKRQSPINVDVDYKNVNPKNLPKFDPKECVMAFVEDIHGLHLTCSRQFRDCGTMQYRGKEYSLQQIHFHSWSEHHINGRSYPLELHFVHKSKEGELAVFGVLFDFGSHNEDLQKIIDAAEKRKPKKQTYAVLNLANLAGGEEIDACMFSGSLTTPPCKEGVQWVVSLRVMKASMAQIGIYRELVGNAKHNNRPIQSKNGRQLTCAAHRGQPSFVEKKKED